MNRTILLAIGLASSLGTSALALDGVPREFPPVDRSLCTRTATMGGMASYVELVTCLEMKRDVATLPADRGLSSVPAGMNTRP